MRRLRYSILLIAACAFVGCKVKTPQTLNEARNLMVSYGQRGRYDDAIRVAQNWMEKHPEDSLYDQVAIIYLVKASKDGAHKDRWIEQAVANFEKDLQAHKMGAVDIELYEVGQGFERAGDLSTHDNCLYYGRAVKAFEDEVQFIQGESYTAYGSTTPLAPARQGNEKALERVKSKFDKAGCK